MINEKVDYPPKVREYTKALYELFGPLYKREIVLGDVHGPSRYAMAVKIVFGRGFILLECNTGSWRISVHHAKDEACAHGVIFDTEFQIHEVEDFYHSLTPLFSALI